MFRASRFLGFGGPLVVSALILNAIAAHAFGPYTSGAVGYDFSYPQCSSATLPTGSFTILGVNGGRPFSYNSCFAGEYAAGPNPSAYINSAYSGAYRKNITGDCGAQAQSMAWQIGCSEAETAFNYVGGKTIAMYWLDVETGNSWSTSNLRLNRDTINGAIAFFVGRGYPAGVYSTTSMWRTITGTGFTPASSSADWVAGQGGACPGTPFDGKTVWLSQYGSGGFDADKAC
jgi:hypothetical protein